MRILGVFICLDSVQVVQIIGEQSVLFQSNNSVAGTGRTLISCRFLKAQTSKTVNSQTYCSLTSYVKQEVEDGLGAKKGANMSKLA